MDDIALAPRVDQDGGPTPSRHPVPPVVVPGYLPPCHNSGPKSRACGFSPESRDVRGCGFGIYSVSLKEFAASE